MTYVVQEACVKCKYADCVEVCPVNCFYEADDMLVINPEECIDCSACVPACPVEAITGEDEAEDTWLKKNAEFDFQEDKRREDKNDVTPGINNTERKPNKEDKKEAPLIEYTLDGVVNLPESIDSQKFLDEFIKLVESHGGMFGGAWEPLEEKK